MERERECERERERERERQTDRQTDRQTEISDKENCNQLHIGNVTWKSCLLGTRVKVYD